MISDFSSFSIARIPRIEFGCGSISKLADLCRQYGTRILLVTGARSFQSTIQFERLKTDFLTANVQMHIFNVDGEPSPQLVDEAVEQFSSADIDVVLGIGGGSALDAAKAIAGLLKVNRSVMDYLEGVGPELVYQGPSVPFIAVPTTAGTGSEATKNAVLSVQGSDGFKKSFRDDKLVAEYAVIDPDLLASCPKNIIAANGMDALTQLIESYVSTQSNVFTDALALSGLRALRDSLLVLYDYSGDTRQAREKMAYAALLSGITLAQTGLGSVHGLASPLGAFYPMPHGVVCGTLVAEATDLNIRAMLCREANNPALDKYSELGDVLNNKTFNNKHASWEALSSMLQQWTEQMALPGLSFFGLDESGLDHVVAHCRGSSMKTNPIVLTDEELRQLLFDRL
ncbi:MAG: iron-containing alcohol dehydrogenase [Gammaproteobacteria bacterium]|nr:iron-containing alcohol dehydrogenase [Gammaproteobacteria bacterium]MCW9005841.1 iron-containing alcohol dehydrogenase [Gammaproteobacteria bacterium]MCW9056867.1 iron-containing alcohol dehydrogenase [Gammaproteobacteria bacterium]